MIMARKMSPTQFKKLLQNEIDHFPDDHEILKEQLSYQRKQHIENEFPEKAWMNICRTTGMHDHSSNEQEY